MKDTAQLIKRHNDPTDPLTLTKITSASGITFSMQRYNVVSVDEAKDTITFLETGLADGSIELQNTPLSTVDAINFTAFDPSKDLPDDIKNHMSDDQIKILQNKYDDKKAYQKDFENFGDSVFNNHSK